MTEEALYAYAIKFMGETPRLVFETDPSGICKIPVSRDEVTLRNYLDQRTLEYLQKHPEANDGRGQLDHAIPVDIASLVSVGIIRPESLNLLVDNMVIPVETSVYFNS